MSTSASTEQKETTPATQTGPDPMADALRQAASSIDNGEETTDDAILQASGKEGEGKPAGGTAGKKPTSESDKQGAAADPAGKSGESKDGKDKDGKPTGEAKPGEQQDSKEEKARKDAERLERNWKNLQTRDAELKQRERALAEREQRLRTGGERRTGPLKDKAGYSVADYETAAAAWEKKGDFELADLAKEAAKKLRQQEQTEDQRRNERDDQGSEQRPAEPPEHTPGTPEFRTAWDGHLAELEASEEYKDLKNKESELFKGTAQLLHQEPRLSRFNDGIRIAAEIVKLRLEAGSASALSNKLEEANKELDKLRKATSPGAGGGESRGAASKPFEDMSPTEQKAHLKRQAGELDNS